jgi:hypothetical protein
MVLLDFPTVYFSDFTPALQRILCTYIAVNITKQVTHVHLILITAYWLAAYHRFNSVRCEAEHFEPEFDSWHRQEMLSSLSQPDRLWVRPASYFVGTRPLLPKLKRPERVSDHSPSSSVKRNIAWNFTSTPQAHVHGTRLEPGVLLLLWHFITRFRASSNLGSIFYSPILTA